MQGSDNGFVKMLQYDEQDEVVNPEFNPDSHYEEMTAFYDVEFVDNIESVIYDGVDPSDDGQKQTYNFLVDLMKKGKKASTYASEQENANAAEETNGLQTKLLVFPGNKAGLSLIVSKEANSKNKSIEAIFPFIKDGFEYPCRILSVMQADPDYAFEGQLEAFVDEEENLVLTFFDINYLDNKALYKPDGEYKFVLTGLAHSVEIIENEDLISLESADNAVKSEKYNLNTVVREIEEYSENVNGQKVWGLTVVLGFSPDGEDIPLKMYLTEKSLGDSSLPNVGDNIAVNFSLHGYLCGVEA
ncbi:MAG: hypothetical protein II567_00465 [Candidatus Riflebacteria bacterium]|nr:hypothetical protein [Candidatus Riflebacteria bacterium]